jgi:hypothetical protein
MFPGLIEGGSIVSFPFAYAFTLTDDPNSEIFPED